MRLLALSAFSLAIFSAAQAEELTPAAIWADLNHSVGRCAITRDPGQPSETSGHCSCALIAPDAVITAQHCIHQDYATRSPDAPKRETKIRFRLGAGGPEYGAIRVIARGQGEDHRPDWITLRLQKPVENGKPIPISLAPAGGDQLAIIGYGELEKTEGYTAKVRTNCKILVATAASILHDCQLLPGDSGSALLASGGAGWRIIGINDHFLVSMTTPTSATVRNHATPASRDMLTGLTPQ